MSNIIQRFYLLSKLSTTLVLLCILIFLAFLFSKAYLDQDVDTDGYSQLKSELESLSRIVDKNTIDAQSSEKIILNNKKIFNNINTAISKLENSNSNEILVKKINEISKENQYLKNELINLTSKIELFNNSNYKLSNFINDEQSINSLVKLIKIKLENGKNIEKEVYLLEDLNKNNDIAVYIEKLKILANNNFIGIENLKDNFNISTSQYLNDYIVKKNNNAFIKYFLNIVSLQPNLEGKTKDETIKVLVIVKKKLNEKDIKGALSNLLIIDNINIFFEEWINDANYYLEFEEIVNTITNMT